MLVTIRRSLRSSLMYCVCLLLLSGGISRGGKEEERDIASGIRLHESVLERKQQCRENLQRAARERHAVLFCSDQRHGDGMNVFLVHSCCCSDDHCGYVCVCFSLQHGAKTKAFSLYTDLLNNRLTGESDCSSSVISCKQWFQSV